MDNIIMISEKELPAFARQIADMVMREIITKQKEARDPDPYMDARQLEEVLPSMTASTIKRQIRDGKYGRKIGAKGKLVAKASEVKKFNRL